MARPRVLLTGFGPFPGVADNPSAWLAETLAQRPPLEVDAEFHVRVLPTAWQAAQSMPRLYDELQPHVMIHFGVSQGAKTFRIERFAHNRAARRADAHGLMPSGLLIQAEGAERFDTKLPGAAVAAHLRACGVAAESSRAELPRGPAVAAARPSPNPPSNTCRRPTPITHASFAFNEAEFANSLPP